MQLELSSSELRAAEKAANGTQNLQVQTESGCKNQPALETNELLSRSWQSGRLRSPN